MTFDWTTTDADTLLRALRHAGRLSQRDVAEAIGVPKSTIGDIESRITDARWGTLARLLQLVGCRLVIVSANGDQLQPWEGEAARDRGGRLLPAHTDLRPVGHSWAPWNQYRDDLYGRRRTHTYDHPKPHSRWVRWRDWRRTPVALWLAGQTQMAGPGPVPAEAGRRAGAARPPPLPRAGG